MINKYELLKWLSNRKLDTLRGDVLQSFCVVLGRSKAEEAFDIINAQKGDIGARMAAMFFQNFGGTIEEAQNIAGKLNGVARIDATIGIVQRYQKKFPEKCLELFDAEVAKLPGVRPMDD